MVTLPQETFDRMVNVIRYFANENRDPFLKDKMVKEANSVLGIISE